MAITIVETFNVQAPAERVWRYLTDPQQVVGCLPGAELTRVEDANTFLGKVKLKVGPVTVAYDGRARFTEKADADRRVKIVAEGRETGGAGSAKMTMTSEVTILSDDSSSVRVEAVIDVVGKIIQFGRGMVESVTRQLFRQFADCLRTELQGAPSAVADATRVAQPPEAKGGSINVIPLVGKAAWETIKGKTTRDRPREE
ncbi:MAG: SRPBCC family protein [Anaerolineae bacterium]|nr:SRPBCC family protein [Gemmatimonadaceae bacterium]